TDFITTGTYNRNRSFHTTISPSMDILISSNLERLLYHLSDSNDELIASYMSSLNETGKYTVSDDILNKIKEIFVAGYCSDENTVKTIAETFKKYNYVIDTHTSVAVNVYENYLNETGDKTPTVIASTANPFKFNEAVISALAPNINLSDKSEFDLLDILAKEGNIKIPPQLDELRSKTPRFNTVCEKDLMINQTDKFLN
ncbi:MAG: threonine synthase, partial [Clostridia bacterium]|nr:threonine synthase [Clostridia bacterium]